MATVNFYLKESASKFETPINVLFHFDGNRFKLSSGEKIAPKYWNPKSQRVKSSSPGSPEFNTKLDFIEEELKKVYRLSITSKTPLSKEYIRNEMMQRLKRGTQKKKYFFDYLQEFIEIRSATNKPNTVKKFRSLDNHLKLFEQETRNRVSFENMDAKFYEQFTTFLRIEVTEKDKKGKDRVTKVGHLNNTVAKYTSNLKSFLHWATERGYNNYTGFLKFKSSKDDADIIYLTEKELMKLYSFDFKGNKRLSQVRDIFCFSCFTGLRYGDTTRLREENVKDDEIHFKTEKTRDSLIVPLNEFAKEILNKYEFKLPSISNQKTNQYLKEMGEVAGLNDIIILTKYRGKEEIQRKEPKYKFLSSHTGRRTFVTLSLEKGMRAETVMSITGHKDYKTFKKYIKITSKVKQVEMNQVWKREETRMKVV